MFKKLSPNFTKFSNDYLRESLDANSYDYTDPVNTSEKEVLDEMFEASKEIIYFEPVKDTNILDNYYNKYKRGILDKEIKLIIKAVCDYLKLDYRFLDIRVYPMNKYLKCELGYFIPKGNIGGEMGISISTYYDFPLVVAIIVHECMHYFMHVNNIIVPDEIEEYFTDLMAVYMGLGKYLVQGYRSINIVNENFIRGFKSIAVGYLTDEHLLYLHKLYNQKEFDLW